MYTYFKAFQENFKFRRINSGLVTISIFSHKTGCDGLTKEI